MSKEIVTIGVNFSIVYCQNVEISKHDWDKAEDKHILILKQLDEKMAESQDQNILSMVDDQGYDIELVCDKDGVQSLASQNDPRRLERVF